MRTLHLCFLLLLCTRVPAQNATPAETKVPTTIQQATVYLAGAQVQRTGTATLPTGRTTLILDDLTSGLDPESVQVSAEEDEILIISVSHRLNFYELPERDETENSLYDRIDRLEAQRRRLQAEVTIAQEEEAVLKANRDLGGTASGLDAEDLERGVTYQRERIRAIKMTYLALDDSLRANQQARELLQKEIATLGQQRQRPATSEVVVVVESEKAQTANLQLTYLVDSAYWTPEYDVRLDDLSQPLDLRYRARVVQQSGEDWEEVALTLSTGEPRVSAEAPELVTWRLRNGQRPPDYRPVVPRRNGESIEVVSGIVSDENGAPLIGASVEVLNSFVGTVTDFEGHYELELPKGSEALRFSYIGFNSSTVEISSQKIDVVMQESAVLLDEVVVAGYGKEQGLIGRLAGAASNLRQNRRHETAPPPVPTQTERRATTVAFAIELPYTIPSNGKARSVEIKRYAVPAEYRHLSVPKITEDVYLSAIVRDWEQYDLISGDLQLFFEGTYLGTSYLDVSKTADSLQLSLGRDAGVVVTRELDETFRKQSGFFGGKHVDSRGWIIAVRNTKARPIDLTVIDQVPVSAQGNIDVELEVPTTATLDEKMGQVEWTFQLPAGSERKLQFGYRAKYPAGQRVYLE